VPRLLNDGALVSENHKIYKLAEVLAAPEKGLAQWFKDEEIG
jgi:hypothetical protein